MDKKIILSKPENKEMNGDFQYVIVDRKAIISEYLGTDTEVLIPSEINGCKVAEIAAYAFKGAKFENITLPNSLESISYGAFTECENLKKIVIPASVMKIGETAFKNCKNLLTVHIDGGNLKQLPKYIFKDCVNLISVSFGKDCTIDTIQELAFAYCVRLTRIELPDSIRLIESGAFSHCKILSEVIFPNEQVTVRKSAFEECIFDMSKNKNIILKSDPFKRQVKETISDLGTEGIATCLLAGWVGIVIILGILALIFGWV